MRFTLGSLTLVGLAYPMLASVIGVKIPEDQLHANGIMTCILFVGYAIVKTIEEKK